MRGADFLKIYGYVRVSTAQQNEDRQIKAMTQLKIPQRQIYVDKVSGKDFQRLEYISLLKKIKEGDLIYIKSIDRLGRNYSEIQNQWRIITKDHGANIAVIDMPLLDTRKENDLMGTFISDIVLQILSFVSQTEREIIHQRQAEGIQAARARGVRLGRPSIKIPKDFEELVGRWEKGGTSLKEVLKETGLKEATFYRRLREFRGGRGLP